MATEAPTPAQLGPEGLQLWSDIVTRYDLRPDEVRILADACREVDIVERLESALRGADLMTSGSMGQKVASPLVSELRQHRTVTAALLKSLKLPDSDSQSKQKAAHDSEQARAAARVRWDARRSS